MFLQQLKKDVSLFLKVVEEGNMRKSDMSLGLEIINLMEETVLDEELALSIEEMSSDCSLQEVI